MAAATSSAVPIRPSGTSGRSFGREARRVERRVDRARRDDVDAHTIRRADQRERPGQAFQARLGRRVAGRAAASPPRRPTIEPTNDDRATRGSSAGMHARAGLIRARQVDAQQLIPGGCVVPARRSGGSPAAQTRPSRRPSHVRQRRFDDRRIGRIADDTRRRPPACRRVQIDANDRPAVAQQALGRGPADASSLRR